MNIGEDKKNVEVSYGGCGSYFNKNGLPEIRSKMLGKIEGVTVTMVTPLQKKSGVINVEETKNWQVFFWTKVLKACLSYELWENGYSSQLKIKRNLWI